MSSDDTLIKALQMQVKKEVVDNYFRDRRILEEETNILKEDACALHGGLAAWERHKLRLALALLTPAGRRDFFARTGMQPPPEDEVRRRYLSRDLPRVHGLTRNSRYAKLVERLYQRLWEAAQPLREEKARLLGLLDEVNRDIVRFEANNDFLTLAAYLRSLDSVELARQNIMGDNFTARERELSAASLAFRPVPRGILGLDGELEALRPPEEVLDRAGRQLVRELGQAHPDEAEAVLSGSIWG
ncbi:MAG: hypothetical protein KQJ78_04310 [Deltaproteobacteria bacterium]|nr:hypothetical protein [Deltaproteobacteria bacterium]